jgi:hypothetical protein
VHNQKKTPPISQSKGSQAKAEKEVEVKLERQPLASRERSSHSWQSKLRGEKEMSKQ